MESRTWDDYSIGRADALSHLAALDMVYTGVITSHRAAIAASEESDPVTQDMLIGQSAQLEQFQWFVRAHLESSRRGAGQPRGAQRAGGRGQCRSLVR